VLPTLGFRNTWSWGRKEEKPELKILAAGADMRAVAARHRHIGERSLYCQDVPDLLFTEKRNDTQRAFDHPNQQPYCKDGIIQAVVHGNNNASVGSLDRYNDEKQLRGPGDLSFLSSEAGEVSQPP